jgi:hypothetical protein
MESERLFIPQGGRNGLPTFVKCGSEGFCPTSVVKKGPQGGPISRGWVFINISKIFNSQTMKLSHPFKIHTHIYTNQYYSIRKTFFYFKIRVADKIFSLEQFL